MYLTALAILDITHPNTLARSALPNAPVRSNRRK